MTHVYLIGGMAHEAHVERVAARSDLGLMIVPHSDGYRSKWLVGRRLAWAGDNGAFSKKGFREDRFLTMLENPLLQAARAECMFVAAPDCLSVTPDKDRASIQFAEVLGNARRTLEMFERWGPVVRDHGFPVALVAQDGFVDLLDEVPWDDVDVIFVGGSDDLKQGPIARRVVEAAVERGKPVHMGRVNSYRRMRVARDMGCTSSDGTAYAYQPDANFDRIVGWMDQLANEGLQGRMIV